MTSRPGRAGFSMMRRASLAAAFVIMMAGGGAAQTDVAVLVDRAVAYVERFQENFGSVVAEERYEQRLRRVPIPGNTSTQQRGGGGPQETTLVSDFLLVEVKGEGWLPFRDVFERDGKQVRDREARLATIFLKGGRNAIDQARAVMDEGARYNIGNINRNINTPTLALAFLTERHRGRFEFKLGQARRFRSRRRDRVREKARPTFVATTGGRDLPVSGTLLDQTRPTARSFVPNWTPSTPPSRRTSPSRIRRTTGSGCLRPSAWRNATARPRDPMEVHGVATYSRFRRFQVSTSEELAPGTTPTTQPPNSQAESPEPKADGR